jgi:hypothetical protein
MSKERSPVQAYASEAVTEAFDASRARFDTIVDWLAADSTAVMTHAEVEERVHTEGMAMLCQLVQDSIDLRAARETRLQEVVDVDGYPRGTAEPGHQRALLTRFGPVTVTRIAYRARQRGNLHPADAVLNLPPEQHSHGLRRLAALEAARGSFADAADAVHRATTVRVGKRQVEDLAARAAADVDAFYTAHTVTAGATTDTLVLQFDAKGVVMRPDSLREHTAKQATSRKLSTRLSRGEKRYRKRMAEVGAVYDLTPAPRTIADILPDTDTDRVTARPTPTAHGKWLTASVTDDAAQVITAGFDEATRRDPDHQRDWVVLVDGNTHQIQRIRAEARARNATVTVVIDVIHVIEYLWKAAWCFFTEGDPAVETWVRNQATAILAGRAGIVAAAIRRKATYHGLDPGRRKPADVCATYLINTKPHLDYPTALTNGWPIATGVIEGACRHLVKDRLDITGARWGLDGAEAILKLRALISNNDFDQYWTWHLDQEQQRIHHARYHEAVIPTQ